MRAAVADDRPNPEPQADYIRETGITIDHERGTCRIDTTDRRTAGALVRRGWTEIATKESDPYRSFLGRPSDLTFRDPRKPGRKGNPKNVESSRRNRAENERGAAG